MPLNARFRRLNGVWARKPFKSLLKPFIALPSMRGGTGVQPLTLAFVGACERVGCWGMWGPNTPHACIFRNMEELGGSNYDTPPVEVIGQKTGVRWRNVEIFSFKV